jgi:hypothetical protein
VTQPDPNNPPPAPAAPTPAPAPSPPPPPAPDPGRAGGDGALRADLARERDERQRIEQELADLRKQSETDKQREIREATEAARKEEREKADTRERELIGDRVRDRVEVAAAGRFNDPGDAYAQLSSKGLLPGLIKDGRPDEDAIKKAVDQVLTDKPYLAKSETGGGRGRDDDRRRRETGGGGAHQGAGRGGGKDGGSDVRERQLARARAREGRRT